MQISIQQLKKTPAHPVPFSFTASAEAMDLLEEGVQAAQPVTVFLSATYHGGSVLLQGKMSTTVSLECSRCLKRFAYPLEIDIDEQVPVDDQLTLDVSGLLREHYFTMFPAKPLCHSACRGLCPSCGINQNDEQCDCQTTQEDHRFSSLKKLLS